MKKILLLLVLLVPMKAADRVENDLLAQEGKVAQQTMWYAAWTAFAVSSFLHLCNIDIVEEKSVTWVQTILSFSFTAILYSLRYQNVREWIWENKSNLMVAVFSLATAIRFLTDIGMLDGRKSESLGEVLGYLGVYSAYLLYKLRFN